MAEPLVILGAGAAGLSAALHAGPDVPVYEQATHPGGLCRSHHVGGYRFDETAHVFHFQRPDIRQLVASLLGENLKTYHRQARVYTHGRLLRYPFQAHLYGLPDAVVAECVRGYQEASAVHGEPPVSFETWVMQRLGPGIARHFMIPYNRKFWTLPPSALSCAWAERFVPVPSLEQMIRGAVTDDPAEYGYNIQFAYPLRGGMAALIFALMAKSPGIQLGKRVARIDLTASAIWFTDGTSVAYERAISTIPLPELRHVLWPLPDGVAAAFERLRWIALYVLHLGVRDAMDSPGDWVYFPEAGFPFFRVGAPSRYAPDSAPPECRTLSVEVTHSAWEPLSLDGLESRIVAQLVQVGLLQPDSQIDVRHPVFIRYGYPIYDHAYGAATETILTFLRDHGIIPAGRFGRWAYLSLEDSLLDGMQAAQECLPHPEHVAT